MLRWPGRDPHGESDRKEEQAVEKAFVNGMVLHGRLVLRAPLCAD